MLWSIFGATYTVIYRPEHSRHTYIFEGVAVSIVIFVDMSWGVVLIATGPHTCSVSLAPAMMALAPRGQPERDDGGLGDA